MPRKTAIGAPSPEPEDKNNRVPEILPPSYAGHDKLFIETTNAAAKSYGEVSRAYFSTFDNIRPGISSRPQFDRETYEYFRPGESLPKNYKDMVAMCDNMYRQFTLVRNIIDLMSDFACQGIKLVHPIKTVERFYNAWFKKVNGFDRSERFLNYFYRHAMVVIEAQVGRITKKTKDEYSNAEQEIISNEIPLSYIFHHPALVYPKNPLIINDETQYEIVIDKVLGTQEYLNQLSSMGFSDNKRPLPIDTTFVHYYKRDEWQVKPIPFLYPIIKHAIMLEKLNLADSAALDGAISAVRIFKLGNIDAKLAPTAVAVNKLNELLQGNVGGGTLDLIWGPDIELLESNTNVHQFLGEAKYAPHLHQMYIGLGIPPSLAGSGGTGTTNNYISLKVLTKRLQYGRRHLIEFWEKQIKWVQKAMGFARPAKIEFDFLDLGDEQTEKQLLIQLADRNLISDEKLQGIFGHDPDMEKSRLNKENRERRTGRRVAKISALPDSLEAALEKISLQKGYVTPAQLGVQLEKDTEKEKSPFDKQLDVQKIAKKNSGQNPKSKGKTTRGRPSGSKDSTKRKTKAFKPKIKAALEIWASDAQKKINELARPKFLKLVGKSNFRQLTTAESKQYEKLAFSVLFNIKPFSSINKNGIADALNKEVPNEIYREYKNYTIQMQEQLGRELTLDEIHRIQSMIYATIYKGNLNG